MVEEKGKVSCSSPSYGSRRANVHDSSCLYWATDEKTTVHQQQFKHSGKYHSRHEAFHVFWPVSQLAG
jgi:hypothetical protein